MAKVRLNRKVAVILLGVAVAGGAGIATAHRVQKRIGIENARQVGLQAAAEGDWERATGNLKYYLDAEPDDVEALQACATAVLDGYNSRAEAYELLERVLKADPSNNEVRQQQVSLALALGWNEPAAAHIAVLLERSGDDAEVQYLAGRCEDAAGRSAEALAFYTQAAKLDPSHVGTNQKLLLALTGVPDQASNAEAIAARLSEGGDETADTLKALARYHAQRQQFDEAYTLICKAADAGPLDNESLLLGTRLATRQAAEELAAGQTDDALKLVSFWQPQLETAIESGPESTWADVSLVMLQRSAGQNDEALQSLRSVINRVPGQLDLQFQLAWQLLELGRVDEAETVALALPDSTDGLMYQHLLTGLVAVQKQQWPDAREKLQQAIESGVEPAVVEIEVRLQHAASCLQAEDWSAAEVALSELLRKYPGHRLAAISLAFCRLAQGNYQQAVLDLRRVDGLKILLSGSDESPSSSATAATLRFQLPTSSILKTLAVPERRREHALLTSLLAVCRGDFKTAQKLRATAGDSAPNERLFDLVSLSSTGRTVSVDELQLVVSADPDDSRAISALFAAWAHQNEPREIDAFVRSQLTDLNSDTWVQRALVLASACSNSSRMLTAAHPELGKSLSTYAETLFRKAAELDPSTTWQLVSFLAAHTQRDEALKLCRSAWATNPGMISKLWLTHAQSHSDPASELQALEQRIQHSLPRRPAGPSTAAVGPSPSEGEAGDRDSEVQLRLVLGDLSLMTLRYAQAEAEYGRVVEIDPDNATAANNLAWLLAMQVHDLDRALALVSHAMNVDGRSVNLLDTRACVHLARNEVGDALSDLNEAASQATNADVEFHRAVAFQRLGQKQAAVECLRRAGKLGFDLHQRPPLEHPMCLELRDLWAETVATNLP